MVVTFLLLPFSKLLEKLAYLVIKQLPEETQKEQLILPGEILLNTPAVAIEACRTSVNDMARLAEDTILKALSLHDNYSECVAHAVSKQEKLLDQYEDKLNAYIVRISKHSIASSDNRTLSKMLHGIGNFERIGDHALNVAQSAQEMHDKQISFSTEAKSELQTMRAALTETVHLAFDAFCKDDLNLAHQVEPMEEVIDTFNMRMKKKTWILTFESTTQAMAAEKYAMEQNLPGRLIPIPREITAGCGLSWKAVPEARDEILTALEKAGCHWEGEYILEL